MDQTGQRVVLGPVGGRLDIDFQGSGLQSVFLIGDPADLYFDHITTYKGRSKQCLYIKII